MTSRYYYLTVWLLSLVLAFSTLAAEEPTPQEKPASKAVVHTEMVRLEIKVEL